MTLVEFLQARLTEDEPTALAAVDGSPHWRASFDYRDVKDEQGHYVVQADARHPNVEQAAHMARHCPVSWHHLGRRPRRRVGPVEIDRVTRVRCLIHRCRNYLAKVPAEAQSA